MPARCNFIAIDIQSNNLPIPARRKGYRFIFTKTSLVVEKQQNLGIRLFFSRLGNFYADRIPTVARLNAQPKTVEPTAPKRKNYPALTPCPRKNRRKGCCNRICPIRCQLEVIAHFGKFTVYSNVKRRCFSSRFGIHPKSDNRHRRDNSRISFNHNPIILPKFHRSAEPADIQLVFRAIPLSPYHTPDFHERIVARSRTQF